MLTSRVNIKENTKHLLTGFARILVVDRFRFLLFVIIIVRFLVVEAMTNVHTSPESQSGQDKRDPPHLSCQCRRHPVHLQTKIHQCRSHYYRSISPPLSLSVSLSLCLSVSPLSSVHRFLVTSVLQMKSRLDGQ